MEEEIVDAVEVVGTDGVSGETPVPDMKSEQPTRLRVGIVGNNLLAKATEVAFNTKSTDRKIIDDYTDIDQLIEWKPVLTVICADIDLLKNDTLNDVDFLTAINKLVKQVGSAICIRSTMNIEVVERLMGSLGKDLFDVKIIYMPELSDQSSIGEIISAEVVAVGGSEKSIQDFLHLVEHTSHLSFQNIVTGTVFEVAYAKLGVAGFKAVKQTYFNQLYDTIMDVKNANPAIVRRMMERCPDITDRSTMIPTFVRAHVEGDISYKQARSYGGEYLNRDVRMLVGMSDKLPLVDECVNFKNLKD
jgi:hypothetical protein